MSYFTLEKKTNFHLIFLLILSLNYLIPFFLIGQLVVNPHDILDHEVVYNHIIGKIYKGDFESINLFLAGEIEWYFLRRIFQPLTLLYAIFNSEFAFWVNDIIIKLTSYMLFFKLSRKLNCSLFYSSLIACFYASISIPIHWDLGMACFPYLIYLLLKNKDLRTKHLFIITFIGLGTDLVRYISIIPTLYIISLILWPKNLKYNYKIFFKISLIFIFFIFLSNSNLVYSQFFTDEPFHRIERFNETVSLNINFLKLITGFFSFPLISGAPYFFHELPINFAFFSIILISLFSRKKILYQFLFFIFLIYFSNFLSNLEFVNSIKNNSEGFLRSFNFGVIFLFIVPILKTLLFVQIPRSILIKKKYFIYPLIIIVLLAIQIKISVIPITKNYVSFNNLSIEQKNLLRKYFHEQKYIPLLKEVIKLNKNKNNTLNQNFKSKYTFKGYYDYENYKYIKSLINDSKTISIGLDPMVAVMNNIGVIDGYHNLYPLSYKNKFRKIIEKQLEHYEDTKKYYDLWGNRLYTFVSDPEIIKIDFQQAKNLGANYVISKYPISNEILLPICKKCNESNELFLYKIRD